MAQSTQVLEGCFAVNKPQNLSSADVIRVLQASFKASNFFAPWFEREEQKRATSDNPKQYRRRHARVQNVKLGHGGTLDPLATGVLIIGAGSGTKQLGNFLGCTKSYETVVLFGAATDTYDVKGKIIARAPYTHITREKVEEALSKFRGEIQQRPPIFSALRINGKRAYEYAREGAKLPKELAERPVTISSLELVEWLDAGTHSYQYPVEEAERETKEAARKFIKVDEADEVTADAKKGEDNCNDGVSDNKRGRASPSPEASGQESKRRKQDSDVDDEIIIQDSTASPGGEAKLTMAGALPPGDGKKKETVSELKQRLSSKFLNNEVEQPETTCLAPAVRLRMTVSSGTYVRSLAHDLGSAVGSLGIMAALVRSRQENFELGQNVLELETFEKSEEEWAPKLEAALKDWTTRTSEDNT